MSTAVDRFSEISSQDKSPMSSNMAGRGICFTGRNIKLSGGTPDMSDYKQGKHTGEYKGYNMLQLHDSDLSFFFVVPLSTGSGITAIGMTFPNIWDEGFLQT